MNELLQSIDWTEIITTIMPVIWTGVCIPIGKQIYDWLKSKKLDKYADILYEEVVKSVKSVYETTVKNIKGTEEWTEDKMEEVKEIAKDKAIQALSSIVYKTLKEANSDFEEYLDTLIDTVLYDLKHNLK